MRRILKALFVIVLIAFAGSAIYYFRAPVVKTTHEFITTIWPPAPCTQTIKYNLGNIDSRFGMPREEVLKTVYSAAGIWSEAAGKPLFEFSTASPDIAINFIYDYRQQATAQLNRLGIVIKNTRAGYESLKAKYNSLNTEYTTAKTKFESDIAAYEVQKNAYSDQVDYWNKQGGAPKDEYNKLSEELATLNNTAADLKQRQNALNDMASTINSVVSVLNRLARELNLNVKSYNTIGSSTGEEFNEGEYIEDATGKRINIYQFNDSSQLMRVLEHEFGHALGLVHSEDPKAIMYRLNQGTNEKLTESDVTQLRTACKL